MICFTKKNNICGASIIGKSHIINGTCNQDFFLIKRKRYGVAMTVCDGVGSNKYSQYGSKSAAKAVVKTFRMYHKNKITYENIGKTIEHFYNKKIRKKHKSAAATTCLFVMIFKNNDIIIGQAGDGIILIKLDEKFLVFQSKSETFISSMNM